LFHRDGGLQSEVLIPRFLFFVSVRRVEAAVDWWLLLKEEFRTLEEAEAYIYQHAFDKGYGLKL
jgi:hypothetical protein